MQRDARVLRERELACLRATSRRRARGAASSCPPRSAPRARAGRPGAARNETPSKRGSPESSLRSPDAISTAMHGRVPTNAHRRRADRVSSRRESGSDSLMATDPIVVVGGGLAAGRLAAEYREAGGEAERHDPLRRARSAVPPPAADEGLPPRRAGPRLDALAAGRTSTRTTSWSCGSATPVEAIHPGRARGRARRRRAARLRDARPGHRRPAARAADPGRRPRRRPHVPDARRRRGRVGCGRRGPCGDRRSAAASSAPRPPRRSAAAASQ